LPVILSLASGYNAATAMNTMVIITIPEMDEGWECEVHQLPPAGTYLADQSTRKYLNQIVEISIRELDNPDKTIDELLMSKMRNSIHALVEHHDM